MVTDRCAGVPGERPEAHGQGERVHAMALVQQVGLEHVGRELGFELTEAVVDALDPDAHRLGRGGPGPEVVELVIARS